MIVQTTASYVALFFLCLFCLLTCFCMFSFLFPLFWSGLAMFSSRTWLVSITEIQSKMKLNIEIKALLYYGLIANSGQSFHYYKILSRVVG